MKLEGRSNWLFKGKQHIWGLTSNTPVKNNGDMSDIFSTARRDTEIMLNACPRTEKDSHFKTFRVLELS